MNYVGLDESVFIFILLIGVAVSIHGFSVVL